MSYIDISNNDINSPSVDEAAIKNSVYNILFTRIGEVPGLPDFGSRIYDFLFDLADHELLFMFRKEVEYVLKKWEPRIDIKSVDVKLDEDYNRVVCNIFYSLKKDIRDEVTSRFISFTVNRN